MPEHSMQMNTPSVNEAQRGSKHVSIDSVQKIPEILTEVPAISAALILTRGKCHQCLQSLHGLGSRVAH